MRSLLALLVVLVAATTASAAGPHATAAKACKAPPYPGEGYFTSLTVTGVDCAAGTKVLKGHYRCRVKQGKTGKCGKPVRGFRCGEKRQTIPTEVNSRVTCTKGSKRVVYTYQQDT